MRAFVTGITGFAGTHLTEHLQVGGDLVLGCSRDGRWRADTPAALQSVPLVAWDLTAPVRDEVRRALVDYAPDCIFHLAAVSVPRECGSGEPTPLAWQANVEGTHAVLRLAATLPRRPRVLLASSCHVYAPVTRDQPVVREDAPVSPEGGYGKTKLAAESALLKSVAEVSLDGVIARAFQHAGPRQDPRLMLSEWCRQIIDPQSLPVRVLSLSSFFDLSDVRDVVRAYRLLALHGNCGEVYNVGSGVCWRSGDLFERLLAIAGRDCPAVELSPGLMQQPIADTSQLHAATGWTPAIAIDQTLADTLEYWRRRSADRPVPQPL